MHMNRPENADIWDGVELKRDDALSEEEKKVLIEKTLDEAMASVERYRVSLKSDKNGM